MNGKLIVGGLAICVVVAGGLLVNQQSAEREWKSCFELFVKQTTSDAEVIALLASLKEGLRAPSFIDSKNDYPYPDGPSSKSDRALEVRAEEIAEKAAFAINNARPRAIDRDQEARYLSSRFGVPEGRIREQQADYSLLARGEDYIRDRHAIRVSPISQRMNEDPEFAAISRCGAKP